MYSRQLTIGGTNLDVVGDESEGQVSVTTASDNKSAHSGLHSAHSPSLPLLFIIIIIFFSILHESGQSCDLPSPRVALPSLTSAYDVLRLCCTARPTRGQVTTVMIQHVTKQMSSSKLCHTFLLTDGKTTVVHCPTRGQVTTVMIQHVTKQIFFFFHLRAHNQHVDYSGAYNSGCSL